MTDRRVTGRAADRCRECGDCGHMWKKHLKAGCLTCFVRNGHTANDSYRHKFVEPEPEEDDKQ